MFHGVDVYCFLFDHSLIEGHLVLLLLEVKVIQSCLTLCDPIDFSLPGSSVHGLLQARILPFPSLGDLSNPGVEPGSPTLQSNSLPSEPPGKPLKYVYKFKYTFKILATMLKSLYNDYID